MNFALLAWSLYLGFFQCLIVALTHLDMNDYTSGQIVPGPDVTCVLVNLPSTHE